ncbi:MAG: hydantoinase/oxoprolinase family protein, partial [Thermoleophilaceae bacterium]
GLDMGGTSCDVSLVLDGRVAVTGGREVGGRSLALPMIDVHTVGAGGGSVAWRDSGGALRAGPRSAGADPGPACYGRGGERPTITDANLLLGYLDAGAPLAGGVELDRAAAERVVGELACALDLSTEDTAAGIARVAAAEMAQAARVMTLERGIDPRELALVSFGGAGGLHAGAIAEELGMSTVIAPVVSGVLSALGLALSERRRDLVESVLLGSEDLTTQAIAETVERLADRGRQELGAPDAEVRPTYELRYAGQAFELPVESDSAPEPADLREAFDDAHEERYGYRDPEAQLELVTVRVAVALPGSDVEAPDPDEAERREPRQARFGDDWLDTEILGAGAMETDGPAIVQLPGSTLVVPPGWTAESDGEAVVMRR